MDYCRTTDAIWSGHEEKKTINWSQRKGGILMLKGMACSLSFTNHVKP